MYFTFFNIILNAYHLPQTKRSKLYSACSEQSVLPIYPTIHHLLGDPRISIQVTDFSTLEPLVPLSLAIWLIQQMTATLVPLPLKGGFPAGYTCVFIRGSPSKFLKLFVRFQLAIKLSCRLWTILIWKCWLFGIERYRVVHKKRFSIKYFWSQ